MADEGERMPIRLVQENGNTISLDATSIDIVVERIQSNFGIPFFDAKKMGIDLNQAQVVMEIQGVMADDLGQEETSKATATLDFYQPQQVVNWGQPLGGGGGGLTSGGIPSTFNVTSASVAGLTGLTNTGLTGGFSSGFGGSVGTAPVDFKDFGNNILKYWNKKYIDFPVAYWVEQSGELGIPVTNGLQLHLKADSLSDTLSNNEEVEIWTDSSGNGRNVNQTNASKRPKYRRLNRFDSYVQFDGVDDFLTVAYSPFLNSEEFTLVVACKNSDSTGVQPVITSTDASSVGYSLAVNRGSTVGRFQWQAPASNTLNTDSSISVKNDIHIFSVTMEDTDSPSDAESDAVTFYVDGVPAETTSTDFAPNTSVSFDIGKDASNFFQGAIFEIAFYNRVLTSSELESVEGYLARKYNTKIQQEGHTYYDNGSYNYDTKHVRLAFDRRMVGSAKEPYGFLNQTRIMTGVTISALSADKRTITVTGGSPDEWFELTEGDREYRVIFRSSTGSWRVSGGRIYEGLVTSVSGSQFTIEFVNKSGGSTPHSVGDSIYIRPVDYGDSQLYSTPLNPVMIIPIKNADTFDEQAAPEKAVGPEFPNHEDGSARDSGGGLTRTDEYITYLLSKALTADYIDLDRPANTVHSSGVLINNAGGYVAGTATAMNVDTVDATTVYDVGDKLYNSLGTTIGVITALTATSITVKTGTEITVSNNEILYRDSTTLDKVFSTAITNSTSDHASRLTITQEYASSLGSLSDTINTNLGVGQMPVTQGFSGGRSGKRVKSGGDKIQDIIGILGNSNNYATNPDLNFVTDALNIGLDFLSNQIGNKDTSGDYIRGIQVPYNSLATKGKNQLDTEVAQRNFFLTTEGNTADKLSSANTVHASRSFSHVVEGHLKNGISGLVTDFSFNREAEMKAYEFSLKFIAADIIL